VEHGAPWVAARARNALRRWFLVLAVGTATFVIALVSLVLVPRQATRSALVIMPSSAERPDTMPLVIAEARARMRVGRADSALQATLAAAHRAAAAGPPPDTLPPVLAARRESLLGAIGSLNRLLARAENAPLPASYRALGETRELRGEPRVRALLDSLADIEREREAFGAVGGVDPIFVALTARAGEVGRAIQEIAQSRRALLRRELATLRPSPPPAVAAAGDSVGGDSTATASQETATVTPTVTSDSAARASQLVAAREAHDSTRRALEEARARDRAFDQRVERARELANVSAPPFALLAAALVLGVAAGFLVSLAVEMVRPRVADAAEAERVAGARVITVIRPYVPNPDRARRRADMEASPLIDASAEGYRMLYLHVSATGSVLPIVTVTGDDADIVATVAANLAVASAYEARSTLLVDGDLGNGAVSGVLRIPPEPGLASVIAEKAVWAESIHATTVGRDRTLDVIPSGIWPLGRSVSERGTERVRRDLRRLTGRYDFAVLVADEAHAERGATSMLPGPDVIIVARAGHTPLAWLTAAVDGLGRTGERVRGIVLWDSEPPRVPTRDEIVATVGERRRRTGVVEREPASI
jgi:Mrp family chromosome partitioning ATPase